MRTKEEKAAIKKLKREIKMAARAEDKRIDIEKRINANKERKAYKLSTKSHADDFNKLKNLEGEDREVMIKRLRNDARKRSEITEIKRKTKEVICDFMDKMDCLFRYFKKGYSSNSFGMMLSESIIANWYYAIKILSLSIISVLLSEHFIVTHSDQTTYDKNFWLIIGIALIAVVIEVSRLKKDMCFMPILSTFHWPKIFALIYFSISVSMLWIFESRLIWDMQLGVFFILTQSFGEILFNLDADVFSNAVTKILSEEGGIPDRESVSNNMFGYYIGDSFLKLCITIFVYALFCWAVLSMVYQIPIVTTTLQIASAAIVWNTITGWEILGYLGSIIQLISESFSVFVAAFILLSYLFTLLYRFISIFTTKG